MVYLFLGEELGDWCGGAVLRRTAVVGKGKPAHSNVSCPNSLVQPVLPQHLTLCDHCHTLKMQMLTFKWGAWLCSSSSVFSVWIVFMTATHSDSQHLYKLSADAQLTCLGREKSCANLCVVIVICWGVLLYVKNDALNSLVDTNVTITSQSPIHWQFQHMQY